MANPSINVIIPLGGLGSRFQKEGYLTRCKPFVPVLGKEMLLWVLENLTLAKDDALVIVFNPVYMSIGNFMREVIGDKYPDCKFVELPGPTRGAAETVLFGLKALEEPIRKRPTLLADGDTFYTADIVGKYRAVASTHNAVFCFYDTQPNPIYSYIRFDDSDDIFEVKEKNKISDWANSGCYCFRDGDQLKTECEALISANSMQKSQDGDGEYYTSGVIAAMIAKKEPFRALKLDVADIHVLGTPSQVEAFCATWHTQPRQRFVFDLEGVLIAGISGPPIARNIETCQRLKKQGHIIIIQSTRNPNDDRKTRAFLNELNVPFDELNLGKPRGDFYISGVHTVDGTLMDLDKALGFYPTEVQATPMARQKPKLKQAKMTQISSLKPDSKGVNCLVKLVDAPKATERKLSNGSPLWEVTCGDASARIILSLTTSQANLLSKDMLLYVRNGFVKTIRLGDRSDGAGHLRLVVDQWGKLDTNVADEVMETVGTKNLSLDEYVRKA